MSNEGRIGIGSSALFTLAGVAAPLLTWWVSGPLMVATGLVAIWGFVPAVQNIFTGNDDAEAGEDIRTVGPSAPSQESHNTSVPKEAPKWVPNWPLRNLFFSLKPDLQQSKNNADFEALADEITDKLSTGQLLAWGRAIGSERTLPLFPIPADYWLRAKLNIWLLDDEPGGGNVLQAGPDGLSAPNKTQYREILLNQAQALGEWPELKALSPLKAIERDTQLAVALAYAVTGKWDKDSLWETDGEPIAKVGSELKRFEQLACDGSLQTWGTRHRNLGPYVKILPNYWEAHHIRFMDLFRESANATGFASLNEAPEYFDIMVSSAQFKTFWPPP